MLKKPSRLFIVIFAFVISGCQAAQNKAFAIYLLAQDIPATELAQSDIDLLSLKNEPIISNNDIISYDKTNHTIELTQVAYSRIQQIFQTPVKVFGIPFVVCVGKERIYMGAFMTPVSSISYDGIVIGQPFETEPTIIQITRGYPGADFSTGKDPRGDPRIIKALEQDKKLK